MDATKRELKVAWDVFIQVDEDAMDAGRVTVDTIWLESLGVVPRLMRRCAGDLIARVSPPPTQLPSDTCGFLLTPA